MKSSSEIKASPMMVNAAPPLPTHQPLFDLRVLALMLGVFAALGAAHVYLTTLPDTIATPLAVLDRLFDLALVVSFVLASLGVGQLLLKLLGCTVHDLYEELSFAFGVGAGAWSVILLMIGLAQLLYPVIVLGMLAGALFVTQREWHALLRRMSGAWTHRTPLSRSEKLLLAALLLLLLPVLAMALLPPTDVDGLVYHLVAPVLFLQHHAVVPSFENIGVNYPIATDILYVFSLSAASDIGAQLVHFAFALALTVGIYGLARQYWTRSVGLLAMVIFWASPLIGLEASAPIIDLGWAFYEFLALWAFLRWRESPQPRQLVLVGIAIGLALSNKYLAAVGFLLLGAFILLGSIKNSSGHLTPILKNLLLYSFAALVVAAPWYLKNWVWLGNPLYPFFFGSYGFDGIVTNAGTDNWVSYGVGHGLSALLLLPWNLYVHWQAFDAAHNRGGPTLLFLFIPFYLITSKKNVLNWLLLYCLARFGFWWLYTQSIRYLIFIFPCLAIVAGYVIYALAMRLRRPSLRFGLAVTVGLFCVLAIGLQVGFFLFLHQDGLPFLFGGVSRQTYLSENLGEYASEEFINENLPSNSHILAIGNARTFYTRRNIRIDDSKSNLIDLVERGGSADGVAEYLKSHHFTHLWSSQDDLTYVENFWDQDGKIQRALPVLAELENHLHLLYKDELGYAIYAIPDTP